MYQETRWDSFVDGGNGVALNDLLFVDMEDDLIRPYVTELNGCQSPEAVEQFVSKWGGLFWECRSLTEGASRITSTNFEEFRAFLANPQAGHMWSQARMPFSGIPILNVSEGLQVPQGVALYQLIRAGHYRISHSKRYGMTLQIRAAKKRRAH